MRTFTLAVALLLFASPVASASDHECPFIRHYRQAALNSFADAKLPRFPGATACTLNGEFWCEWQRPFSDTTLYTQYERLVETISGCLPEMELMYDEADDTWTYVFDAWVSFYVDIGDGYLTMGVGRTD